MSPSPSNIDPSVEQQAAVGMVQRNPISILTGGPGTGKTFTTRLVLNWAKEHNLRVAQAAPTGRAAKRMEEATGYPSSTIHSMLGCVFEKGYFTFNHNAENPLPVDLLVLDEVSMISLDLMASVFEAIDINRTKILLVGDQDQLPSVGPGAILRDFLSSGAIPHAELTKTFRNCGEIVRVCHQIKAGDVYSPQKKLDLGADDPINLIHIERSTPEKTKEAVVGLVTKIIPGKGFDPIDDIQVISPVNESGLLSCKSLNDILQEKLNPIPKNIVFDDNNIWTYKFRKGDRVINTKNTNVTTTDGREDAIVNGDLGIVQYVGKKDLTVIFSDGSKKDDRWVTISRSDENLLHAYAITCHRFQGSEAPVIIIPIHRQFDLFLSKSWIYTALSRGKTVVITVGRWGSVEKAILNTRSTNRYTMLTEEIHRAEDELYDI